MRKIFVFLFALTLIGVALQTGCGSKQTEEKKTEEAKVENPPDFTKTVDDFCEEYRLLEEYGDIPYKGKIILLQGKVGSVSTGFPWTIYLDYLESSKKPYNTPRVRCEMKDFAPVSNVTVGEEISIQGRCEGLSGGAIIMEDCEVR